MTGFQALLLLVVLGAGAVHVLHRFAPRYPTLVGRVIIDLVGLGALLAFVLSVTVIRIPPGYVGIKVNNLGPHRGVQDNTLRTGLVFYAPVATTVSDLRADGGVNAQCQ